VDENGRKEAVVFQRFPEGMNKWTESQINATLSYGCSQFAVRMLHVLLKKLIEGMWALLLSSHSES
jgi:hypothetical protein